MNALEEPFFSIVIPNFNKGNFVAECIESVKNQNFLNWEILFVDDHSTDGSDRLAQQMIDKDDRCTFLVNTTGRKGANAARNLGFERARGQYIIFLDSDDLMLPTSLQLRSELAEKYSDLAYFALPMGLFNDRIGDSDLITNIPTSEPDLNRFLKRDLLWLITGPTWKYAAFKQLGGFDLNLQSQQDLDLHVRALIAGLPYRYFHLAPDTFYRRNVVSEARLNSQSVEHFKARFAMLRRQHELLLKASLNTSDTDLIIASSLLALAQMMRWHQVELGKSEALAKALEYWKPAQELGLVTKTDYRLSKLYILFKHQLLFNYSPFLRDRLEAFFLRRLGSLIFVPSKTCCQVVFQPDEQ